MSRVKLDFDGFDLYLKQLETVAGNAKKAAENALDATHNIVTSQARSAIAKHRRTGKTEESLRLSPIVLWDGDVAELQAGFDIKNGGLPSIFLMHGTPRIEKDTKLYNAFFGNATKKKIKEAQEDAFFDEIDKAMRS